MPCVSDGVPGFFLSRRFSLKNWSRLVTGRRRSWPLQSTTGGWPSSRPQPGFSGPGHFGRAGRSGVARRQGPRWPERQALQGRQSLAAVLRAVLTGLGHRNCWLAVGAGHLLGLAGEGAACHVADQLVLGRAQEAQPRGESWAAEPECPRYLSLEGWRCDNRASGVYLPRNDVGAGHPQSPQRGGVCGAERSDAVAGHGRPAHGTRFGVMNTELHGCSNPFTLHRHSVIGNKL